MSKFNIQLRSLRQLLKLLTVSLTTVTTVSAFDVFVGDSTQGTSVKRYGPIKGATDEFVIKVFPGSGIQKVNNTHFEIPLHSTKPLHGISVIRDRVTGEKVYSMQALILYKNPISLAFPTHLDFSLEQDPAGIRDGVDAGLNHNRVGLSYRETEILRVPDESQITESDYLGSNANLDLQELKDRINHVGEWNEWINKHRIAQQNNATMANEARVKSVDRARMTNIYTAQSRVGRQIVDAAVDIDQLKGLRDYLDGSDVKTKQQIKDKVKTDRAVLLNDLNKKDSMFRKTAQELRDEKTPSVATTSPSKFTSHVGCIHPEAHENIRISPDGKSAHFALDTAFLYGSAMAYTSPRRGFGVKHGIVRFSWDDNENLLTIYASSVSRLFFDFTPPVTSSAGIAAVNDPIMTQSPHSAYFVVGSADAQGTFPWSPSPKLSESRVQEVFAPSPTSARLVNMINQIPPFEGHILDQYNPDCTKPLSNNYATVARKMNLNTANNNRDETSPFEEQAISSLVTDSLICTRQFFNNGYEADLYHATADYNVVESGTIMHGLFEMEYEFAFPVHYFKGWTNWTHRHGLDAFVNGLESIYQSVSVLDDHGASLPKQSRIDELKKDADSCDQLNFTNPGLPLEFRSGCEYWNVQQSCLFFGDDVVMNLRSVSESLAFPTRFDDYNPLLPISEQDRNENLRILYGSNALTKDISKRVILDDGSTVIQSSKLTTISESGILNNTFNAKEIRAYAGNDQMVVAYDRYLDWDKSGSYDKNHPEKFSDQVQRTYQYYPCSVIRENDLTQVVDQGAYKKQSSTTNGYKYEQPKAKVSSILTQKTANNDIGSCSAESHKDIVLSTLRMLPFCLDSLTGAGCSSNCTQAINTYLGKHLASGDLNVCAKKTGLGMTIESDDISNSNSHHSTSSSVLLHTLGVNAATFVSICPSAATSPVYASPGLSNFILESQKNRCQTSKMDVGEYISAYGCRKWDWDRLVGVLRNEWSELAQVYGSRVTKDDDISRAENVVITLLLQHFYNLESGSQVFPVLAYSNLRLDKQAVEISADQDQYPSVSKLWHRPNMGPYVYGHNAMYRLLTNPVNRSIGNSGPEQTLWTKKIFPYLEHYSPLYHSDPSPTHSKIIAFQNELFDKVIAKESEIESSGIDPYDFEQGGQIELISETLPKYVGVAKAHERYDTGLGDILQEVEDFAVRRFLRPQNEQQAERYFEFGMSLIPQIAMPILNEVDSRSHGHMPLTATLMKRFSAQKELNRTDSFLDLVKQAITASNLDVSNVKDPEINGVASVPLETLPAAFNTMKITKFIRDDECKRVKQFEDNPGRFMLEYQRLNFNIPLYYKDYEKNNEVVAVAQGGNNLDPEQFPNPLEFDINRPNLGKVVLHNVFEGDVSKDISLLASDPSYTPLYDGKSTRRQCPGRRIMQRYIKKLVPKYIRSSSMLSDRCWNGNRIVLGVSYYRETVILEIEKSDPDARREREMELYIAAPSDVHPETTIAKDADDYYNVNQVDPVQDPDAVDDVFVFLHGFPHIPQSWGNVIKKTRKRRPSAAYISASLPGWGSLENQNSKTKITNCLYSGDAEKMIAELVMYLNKRFPNAPLYLVGADIGAILAWRVAKKLAGVKVPAGSNFLNLANERDALAGIVSFNPHPHIMFTGMANLIPAKTIPFFPLLNPIIGESLVAAGDFAALQKTMETQFGDAWEKDEYSGETDTLKLEYLRQWKKNGARAMTCYYRDNFQMKRNSHSKSDEENRYLETIDSDWDTMDSTDYGINVLFVKGERDLVNQDMAFKGSFGFLTPKKGVTWNYHTVMGANSSSLIFHDEHSDEVAGEIVKFAQSRERIDWSIYQFLQVPPNVSGGMVEILSHDLTVPYALVAAFLAVMAGIALELYMGPMILSRPDKETWWRFGQIVMVPLCLAAMASRSWLGLPIFFAALFKFGFPEVTTLLKAIMISSDVMPLRTKTTLFIDGVGFLIHHTGTSIIYGSVLGHIVHPLFLICVLPLAGQHAVSFLKYINEHLYGLALLVCEIWFQLEVYHILPHLHHEVARTGLLVLLFAHWIWCVNGLVLTPLFSILNCICFVQESEEEDDLDFGIENRASMDSAATGAGGGHKKGHRASLFMDQNFDNIRSTMSRKGSTASGWRFQSVVNRLTSRASGITGRNSNSDMNEDGEGHDNRSSLARFNSSYQRNYSNDSTYGQGPKNQIDSNERISDDIPTHKPLDNNDNDSDSDDLVDQFAASAKKSTNNATVKSAKAKRSSTWGAPVSAAAAVARRGSIFAGNLNLSGGAPKMNAMDVISMTQSGGPGNNSSQSQSHGPLDGGSGHGAHGHGASSDSSLAKKNDDISLMKEMKQMMAEMKKLQESQSAAAQQQNLSVNSNTVTACIPFEEAVKPENPVLLNDVAIQIESSENQNHVGPTIVSTTEKNANSAQV